MTPEPFVWSDIEFKWNSHRQAYAGNVFVAGRDLWFLLKEDTRAPSSHEAWVEWEDGYTPACTMSQRELALEGAVLAAIDSAEFYLKTLRERFP